VLACARFWVDDKVMHRFEDIGSVSDYVKKHGMTNPEALTAFTHDLVERHIQVAGSTTDILPADQTLHNLGHTDGAPPPPPPPPEGLGHPETLNKGVLWS
jgi:hypothetical protein